MSDSEEHKAENEDDQDEKGEKDSTLKILLSTDNHLGYMEKDPIRRMDSFAAMEQVLQLAVALEVDMVLLSGDLFHENKPSRHTLFQTMRLLRKYCMGPQPIRLEVVNPENLQPFASSTVQANYLDEFYSIGLPIFCIHGNHDDPSRDAGNTDLLAPLDILATANLVNYFGRNDEVNNISIKPVLIKKGSTNLALYGLGSLRDERLHRMWQSQKVKFVKPSTTEEWFNVFTLHQNRDLGRGSKNCIHEGMIPEWMDLVVWGHEHQCLIEPVESLVGTFRITQPGSSVATSLTEGEAVRKHVGLLEIRGAQFRITPLPLTRLRGFAIADLSLSDHLDPDDPKVDLKVLNLLRLQVEQLIDQAREHASQLHDALLEALTKLQVENATQIVDRTDSLFSIQNADQVLCRLRVEHSGFTSLNNQRFGAHLVGQVANPSDILLFTRKRKLVERKQAAVNAASSSAATTAIAPPDLNDTTVEELAYDLLQNHKLDLLNAQQFTLAVEDFVEKEQRQAIVETVNLLVKKQQKALIVRGKSAASPAEVRDLLLQSNIQQNQHDKEPDEDLANPTRRPLSKKPLVHQDSDSEVSPKTTNNKRTLPNKSSFHNDSMDEEESEAEAETPKRSNHGESDSQEVQSSSHEEIEPPPKKHNRATVASTRSKAAPKTSTVRAKKYDSLSEDDEEVVPDQSDSNDDLEDDPVQVVEAAGKKASGRGRGRGKAKSTTTTGRGRGRSNPTQTQTQYDEDGFAAARRASPRRQATASRSRLTANARTQQTQSQLQLQSSQTQSQLTSYLVSRPTVNAKRKAAHYNMDSSDEDEDEAVAAPKPAPAPEARKSKTSNNLASGWGSASQSATQASATKRSKRK